jgi:hypothetical protein
MTLHSGSRNKYDFVENAFVIFVETVENVGEVIAGIWNVFGSKLNGF